MSDDAVRPRLLEISQVARRLNLSDESVRALIHRGELPAIRLGTRWRIEPEELERFIAARRHVTSEGASEACRKLHALPPANGAA